MIVRLISGWDGYPKLTTEGSDDEKDYIAAISLDEGTVLKVFDSRRDGLLGVVAELVVAEDPRYPGSKVFVVKEDYIGRLAEHSEYNNAAKHYEIREPLRASHFC